MLFDYSMRTHANAYGQSDAKPDSITNSHSLAVSSSRLANYNAVSLTSNGTSYHDAFSHSDSNAVKALRAQYN
jgi:hypothetical protein